METVGPIFQMLKNCSSGLLSLNRSTEDDFLAIGNHLKEVSTRSGEVSTTARSAAGLIRGEETESCAGAIEDLLNVICRHLETSRHELRHNTDIIKGIHDKMDSVTVSLAGFARIVKRLSMLSISTKIEASRIEDGESFGSLARDIEVLAAAIGSKSKHIRDAVQSLRAVTGEALSKASVFDASEGERTGVLLREIMGSLSSLREKHAASSKTACFVAGRADEICAAVGQIVSSLQFHDITRQQIEHVTEAIDELCDKMPAHTTEEDAFPMLRDLCIGDVCDVLVRQLSSAQHQLVSAMGGILDNLGRISGYAADVLKEVAVLTDAAGSTSSSFLADLKAQMAHIISSLKENGEANSRLFAAVERVVSTTRDLSGFVEEVEAVGEEIELIALNARVKATKAGMEGAPLSVIAESIRDLSEDACRQTASISNLLLQVAAAVDGPGAESVHGDKGLGLDNAMEKLGGLFDNFDDMDARISALVASMEGSCNVLESRIRDLMSGTTVHRRAEELLGKVVTDLGEVVRTSEKLGPSQSGLKNTELLKRLENRYTMHKERSVHQSVLDRTPLHRSADAHFGDNVELFQEGI